MVVVAGMMSAVVVPGGAEVITVVTSRRAGAGVEVVVLGVEEEGVETEEEVVTSEGCRTLGGVGGAGGALLRHPLGHLGGGMPRRTGGDHLGFFTQLLYLCLCFRFAELALKLVWYDMILTVLYLCSYDRKAEFFLINLVNLSWTGSVSGRGGPA
jgi:hypothetical protein